MMTASMSFSVEKFNGKGSFTFWQMRVKDVLTQQGLARALKGKDGKPKEMTDDQWKELESRCVSTIRHCIADNIINNVMDEDSAPALWEKLEKLYIAKSLTTKLHLKRKLYKLKMDEGGNLMDHMNVFNGYLDQLQKVDVKVEEEDKALLLLTSLPDSYENLVTTLLHGKDTVSLEQVQASLVSYDTQKKKTIVDGGYVITPVNEGKQSLVRHMLAIDWKFWKLYLHPSSARCITIPLRELFRAKAGTSSPEFSSGDMSREIRLSQSGQQNIRTEVQHPGAVKKMEEGVLMEDEVEKPEGRTSLKGLHNAADEFFDVPEPTEYDQFENEWPSDMSMEQNPTSIQHPKLSSAAVLVKRLHEHGVQKKGCTDLQEVYKENNVCPYGATLQKDPSCALPCSWGSADPSSYLIRGPNYLQDRQKIKAKSTLMQLVGVDWLRSDKREVDISSRYGSIVQKYAERGGSEFFLTINMQIPGTTMHTLAFYYMTKTPLEETPLLHDFVNGDDSYRNSRFKLIPYIVQGSWIVKQSVGKKACLIGQLLEVHYFRGKNYLELGIDVGSSTLARGVANFVLGYLKNLVAEMAFLLQANTEEELPEVLLGTCRLNQLDASKSVRVKP